MSDDFKILPTRSGPAQGDATERKMIDKAGGQDTIARVVRRNADGSTTTLKTRGGMPHFDTTVPPKDEPPEDPPTVFVGIPCSHDHQGGYSPVTDPEKPVHEWAKWHKTHPPPNEHASADSPKFKATHEYSVDATPGHHTWYSDQVKVARRPLVVSWKGPMWRSGHYASSALLFSGTRYPTYGDLAGVAAGSSTLSIPGKEFATYLGAAVTHFTKALEGFSAAVWLNGVRCETDNDVWAAAVRKPTEAEPHSYLYYFDGYSLYRRKIKYRERKRGIEQVPESPLLDEIEEAVATFNVTEFPDGETPMTFTSYQLVQMPFINASCTKAVFLIMFCTNSRYWAPSLYEADFETGELTLVVKSERMRQEISAATVNASSDAVGPGTPTSTFTRNYSSITSQGAEWYSLAAPLAADYVGDTLEYLVSESSHGAPERLSVGSWTEANTQSQTYSASDNIGTGTFTYSLSYAQVSSVAPGDAPPLPTPAGIQLRSHLYGQVALLSVPVGTGESVNKTVSASGTGSRVTVSQISPPLTLSVTEVNMDGIDLAVTYTENSDEIISLEHERIGIVDADLRSRTYSFSMFFAAERFARTITDVSGAAKMLCNYTGGQGYLTTAATGSYTRESTHTVKHYYSSCAVAFGEEIYRNDQVFDVEMYDPSPNVNTSTFPLTIYYYPGNSSTSDYPLVETDHPSDLTILGAQFSPYDGNFYGTGLPPSFKVWGPRFTSLAVSPPLKAGASQTGYVSVKFPDCNLLTGPEFHAFLRKRPGEPVEIHPCSAIPYTPDTSKRTITRPLFLPTSLPT